MNLLFTSKYWCKIISIEVKSYVSVLPDNDFDPQPLERGSKGGGESVILPQRLHLWVFDTQAFRWNFGSEIRFVLPKFILPGDHKKRAQTRCTIEVNWAAFFEKKMTFYLYALTNQFKVMMINHICALKKLGFVNLKFLL